MLRILLIDDDQSVARAIGRMLREYELTVETDPKVAVAQIVAGHWFDVILCDVKMPALSGHDILALIRELPEQPAFILMSGSEELAGTGADGTLTKPFGAVKLLGLIDVLRSERERATTRPLPHHA